MFCYNLNFQQMEKVLNCDDPFEKEQRIVTLIDSYTGIFQGGRKCVFIKFRSFLILYSD